jgi:glycosyltransferase involved in cell wall biosynthesis
LRILVVSNLYPPAVRGGYELICADAVNGLRERHEVTVLTSRSHEAPRRERGVVRRLDFVRPGPRGTLLAPLKTLRSALVMRAMLASMRPDMVFVWNGAHLPHAAIRIAELSGVPVLYSLAEHWFGGLYASDQFMRYLRPGERGLRGLWARVVRLFNRLPPLRIDTARATPASIMWISESLRREVPMPPTVTPLVERIIHPAPPDPDLLRAIERRPASDPPTIAFLGRLEAQKGPSVAYRAVAELRDRHGIDVRLKLAGRGTPEKLLLLERVARELDIEDRVELLGQLDRRGVCDLLAEASALVVPSTWEEPFGLVLIEAALARVPVVASRSGGMPEALHEDEHALFFAIGDAAGCADALRRVLTDEEDTAARTARAFERASTFTPAGYTAELEDFIAAAVAAREECVAAAEAAAPGDPTPTRGALTA